MVHHKAILLAALSTAVIASVIDQHPHLDPRASDKINWGKCDKKLVPTNLTSECADFTVPLDYTNRNDNRTVKLQIARIKTTVQPSKGTILLNFGGPGAVSRAALAAQADLLQVLSGYEYDLAAFDSRGTANTIPEECFKDAKAKKVFQAAQTTWYDQSPDTLEQMWKEAGSFSEECYKRSNDTQSFIGTGLVARDLISVVDALGEDGLLRYWGFSYGTTLGATVASMYPDRIDKLIIDGVQNPHQYYHAAADYEEWLDSDRVFSEVFRSCIKAGSTNCPLAAANLTADQLEVAAYKLADGLKEKPISVKGYPPLSYGLLRYMFSNSVYGPNNWPLLATILSMISANQTSSKEFVKIYEANLTPLLNSLDTYPGLFGIHCSDRTVRFDSFKEFVPVQEKLLNISKVMDGSSTSINMACAQWKSEAAGAYSGDFHVKTKNPILIASNKYDGHTPLQSAQNVSSGFEGSKILVVNGFGHTTLAQASVCTILHTAAYWHNGTLPEDGFVCDVDQVPYSDYTWANATKAALAQVGNSTNPKGNDTSSDGNSDDSSDVVPEASASQISSSITFTAIALSLMVAFMS